MSDINGEKKGIPTLSFIIKSLELNHNIITQINTEITLSFYIKAHDKKKILYLHK